MDNLEENIEDFAGNRIHLLDEKPLDKDAARQFIIRGLRPPQPPKGMFIRQPSNIAEYERFNLEDVCTDTVVRLIMNRLNYHNGKSLFYFLNPPEIGRTETPYKKKIPVITKILEDFYDIFYGGHHKTLYSGNIPDITSDLINSNPDRTNFFWFKYMGCLEEWEALYDTQKPETKFMFINLYSIGPEKNVFNNLRQRHEKENLFKDGSVSFIKHIGSGYYIPIIGVTEIIGLFAEPHNFTIQTTLSKKGISCEEVESKQFDKNWLLPEGYHYHDR